MIPHIGLLALLLGIALSVNSGRSIARRKHDADLAKMYGRKLPGLGHLAYLYMLFGLMLNIAALVFMRIANISIKIVFAPLEGGLLPVLEGLIVTLIVITASYVFFHDKYRDIKKPLTMEGRVVLRGLDLGDRAREKTVNKLANKLKRSKEKD